MNVVRMIVRVALLIAMTAFVVINWTPVKVRLWPVGDTFLIVEPPVGIVALVFFVLGLVPMWLLHRADHWKTARRIASLESAARAAAMAAPVVAAPAPIDPPPAAEPPPVP